MNKTIVQSNDKIKIESCEENETAARSNMEVMFKKELIQKVIEKAQNEELKVTPREELAMHFE